MTNASPNWQYPQAQPPRLGPGAPGVLPDSMKWALGLMAVGALLSVVWTSVIGVLNNEFFAARTSLTAAGHSVLIGSSVFGAILQLGLWLWMIWKVRAGRRWARVLSTVFFGCLCLTFLVDLLRGSSSTKSLMAVYFLVALLALIMLYHRDSRAFFRGQHEPAVEFGLRFGQPGYGPADSGSPGYGNPGYPQPRFGQDPQQYPQPPQQGIRGQQPPPPPPH